MTPPTSRRAAEARAVEAAGEAKARPVHRDDRCDPGRGQRPPAFKIEDVTAAVRDAIARGAIGFDAVKHLVLCRIERRPPRLDLTIYPYLPRATVATTKTKAYLDLCRGEAA
jgi:hypothetical protein